jgi:hypothetical protein
MAGFYDAAVAFYETDKILSIFVGCTSILMLGLLLGCGIYGMISLCKNLRRRGSYVLNHKKSVQDGLETYEMLPLDDIKPFDADSREPCKRGVRVMLTDECGNIPSYTLRSRSVDGSPDKYTTFYNYRIVKETAL